MTSAQLMVPQHCPEKTFKNPGTQSRDTQKPNKTQPRNTNKKCQSTKRPPFFRSAVELRPAKGKHLVSGLVLMAVWFPFCLDFWVARNELPKAAPKAQGTLRHGRLGGEGPGEEMDVCRQMSALRLFIFFLVECVSLLEKRVYGKKTLGKVLPQFVRLAKNSLFARGWNDLRIKKNAVGILKSSGIFAILMIFA